MVIGRPADLAARQRNSLRVDRVQKPPLSGRMDLTMASVLRASGRGLICVAGLAAAISVSLTQSACAFGRRSPTVANQNGRGAPAPMVARYAIDEGGEFILDRNASVFQAILVFLSTKQLHLPPGMCREFFRQELAYFGFSDELISPCCKARLTAKQRTALEQQRKQGERSAFVRKRWRIFARRALVQHRQRCACPYAPTHSPAYAFARAYTLTYRQSQMHTYNTCTHSGGGGRRVGAGSAPPEVRMA